VSALRRTYSVLAAIQPPDLTQAILLFLELPSRAPPPAAAVPDPAYPEERTEDFEATL
jgi:hypothetical protein